MCLEMLSDLLFDRSHLIVHYEEPREAEAEKGNFGGVIEYTWICLHHADKGFPHEAVDRHGEFGRHHICLKANDSCRDRSNLSS